MTRMIKQFRLLMATATLAVFLPVTATAQTDFQKAGTTGLVILELPVSPRSSSMGDVRTANADASAEALFNNPAALGFARQRHLVQVSSTEWFAETRIQSAGYVLSVPGIASFGFSVMHFDMGTMQGTANLVEGQTGNFILTDEFSAASTAFGFSIARQMTDRFSFGGTIRYVTENIAEYSASAVAIDVGMIYYTGFRSLRLAGLMQNFGSETQYIADRFRLPITFRLAAAMEVIGDVQAPGSLTLHLEGLHPNNAPERLHVALEYTPVTAVSLRGGYKFGYDEDGLTAGLGLQIPGNRSLALDLAYGDYGRLGSAIGVGLRAGF